MFAYGLPLHNVNISFDSAAAHEPLLSLLGLRETLLALILPPWEVTTFQTFWSSPLVPALIFAFPLPDSIGSGVTKKKAQ